MLSRLITALGLAALVALSVVRITRPPAARPATAPLTEFSAERARVHVGRIAERPHPMGTAEHDRVRDYLLAELGALGVRTEVQTTTAIGTRYQESGRVQNVIGYVSGSTPGGKAVLLVAHYDGVEAGPAAADDGAGVAALLEVARALRARRQPLAHDVILLFTDGEESGLLGAAAFAREHPRARDVAFVVNLEARGTGGRSVMFQTGPGNLDAVRLLRRAGDVSAGSVFTTVYRTLPNDTDLSELAVLGTPALNFAFTRGVELYHTSRDDAAHLDLGSVQHHGAQALAVVIAAASGELPRPKTGDAVFFDLPVLGLVIYPLWVAYLLGIATLALFIVVWRALGFRGVGSAAIALGCVAICVSGALMVRLSGPPVWSGWTGAALVFAAVAINAAAYAATETRRGSARAGGLLLWCVLGIATSAAAPSVSYLFVWPLLFALAAARSRHPAVEWLSAAVALLLLAGFAVGVGVIMLGVSGAGAAAMVAIASLLTWIVGPMVLRVFPSWRSALFVPLATGIVCAVVARVVGVPSADHPYHSALVYAENLDEQAAFLGATSIRDPWTRAGLGDAAPGLPWTADVGRERAILFGRDLRPVGLGRPDAVVHDSSTSSGRELTVHIGAAPGTASVVVRVRGASVARASIDAKLVTTDRYRRPQREWTTEYWNVPPEGATIALTVAPDAHGVIEIAARRPGLPAALRVTARPVSVVASQSGDISAAYRAIRF